MLFHHAEPGLDNSAENLIHFQNASDIPVEFYKHYSESRNVQGERYVYAGVQPYNVYGQEFFAVVFYDEAPDYQTIYTDNYAEAAEEYTAVVLGLAAEEFIFDTTDVDDNLLFVAKEGKPLPVSVQPQVISLD